MKLTAARRERFSRQIILEDFGEEGQKRLLKSSVAVVGCGALGGTSAMLLARAGIGHIRVIDRDVVDISNLPRQILFDEHDVGRPKAVACAEKLKAVDSGIKIEAKADDLNRSDAEELLAGFDIIVDGTDNLETRFLINDVCVKKGIPWVYGSAVGLTGMALAIVPGDTPCLRCILPEPPEPGAMRTCAGSGVINTAPAMVAAMQATEAMNILLGKKFGRGWFQFDLGIPRFETISVARDQDCPCCGKGNYEFILGKETEALPLCGSNSVQILPRGRASLDLVALAAKLKKHGTVSVSDTMIWFTVRGYDMLIFGNGRTIVRGTEDIALARSLYSEFVGV